jgi:dihydroorotate dehydrogenase
MAIQFEKGELSLPKIAITDLYAELSKRISAKSLNDSLDLEFIKKIHNGQLRFSDEEIWPLVRIAYQHGLLSLIPANGLPSVSYQLSDDVNLDRHPIGSEKQLFNVHPIEQPTEIAGYKIDFPLCLPASIIAANASYLKYYLDRGYCVLTYKTVRSRAYPPHPHPQWVFLEGVTERISSATLEDAILGDPQNYALNFREYHGRQRFYPPDRATGSMANSFGVPSHDPKWWMEDLACAREFVRSGHQVLNVSVQATVDPQLDLIKDFVDTATMAREAGADIIELNFSCPNTKNHKTGDIYNSPSFAREIAHAVKKATKLPVFAKIGFLPKANLKLFVRETTGCIDGIVAINTVSAQIDDSIGEPVFPGRPTAGLSGWVIKDVAQEVACNLVEIRSELGLTDDLALLGLGGVMTVGDFWERLNTGVNAVGICTGAFADPLLGLKIREATTISDMVKPDDRSHVTMKKEVQKTDTDARGVPNFGATSVRSKRGAKMGKTLTGEIRRFEGTIVRRDADGFGIVKFDEWPNPKSSYGVFTESTLHTPAANKAAKKGKRVRGTAKRVGECHEIIKLLSA